MLLRKCLAINFFSVKKVFKSMLIRIYLDANLIIKNLSYKIYYFYFILNWFLLLNEISGYSYVYFLWNKWQFKRVF